MKAEATAYEMPGPSNGAEYPEYRGNLPVHTTADVDEYNGEVTVRSLCFNTMLSLQAYYP